MHRAFSCKQVKVAKTFSKNVEMAVPKTTESRYIYREGSVQARQGIKGLYIHM